MKKNICLLEKKPVTSENTVVSKRQLNKLKILIRGGFRDEICLSSEEKVKHVKSIIKFLGSIRDIRSHRLCLP